MAGPGLLTLVAMAYDALNKLCAAKGLERDFPDLFEAAVGMHALLHCHLIDAGMQEKNRPPSSASRSEVQHANG